MWCKTNARIWIYICVILLKGMFALRFCVEKGRACVRKERVCVSERRFCRWGAKLIRMCLRWRKTLKGMFVLRFCVGKRRACVRKVRVCVGHKDSFLQMWRETNQDVFALALGMFVLRFCVEKRAGMCLRGACLRRLKHCL
jgi:hypothetical protein